jgi:hypothetical protein
MPIKKCQSGGKKGLKYGDTGTCYTGPTAKTKALKQAVAIKISQGEIKVKRKK